MKRGDIIDHSSVDEMDTQTDTCLKERMEWFKDQKFGLFMHWGINSVWGICESWPLSPADEWARPDTMKPWLERGKDIERFSSDYKALNKQFNPVKFNPESWADAAKYAGMKYVCFTTKHHDGFCMFDTKTTDFKITNPDCPFHSNTRANVVKEIFETFRQRDFGIWCYFSKSDWHVPYYWNPDLPVNDRNPNYDTHKHPELWEKFVKYTHSQITELLSDYGHVDVLWLDGGQVRPPDQDIRMDEIAEFGRKLQPGLIIADRTVGGKNENFITPEQTVPDEAIDFPWESCITMGPTFAYEFDSEYKPTRYLIHLLIDIVAKGGNLLLNIAPSPEGLFDETAIQRLHEIGDWMAINQEAIYGSRPIAPYKEGQICYTKKGNTVYALILADKCKEIPNESIILKSLLPREGTSIKMLGEEKELSWKHYGDYVEVKMPQHKLPCNHAWVLKYKIKEV